MSIIKYIFQNNLGKTVHLLATENTEINEKIKTKETQDFVLF